MWVYRTKRTEHCTKNYQIYLFRHYHFKHVFDQIKRDRNDNYAANSLLQGVHAALWLLLQLETDFGPREWIDHVKDVSHDDYTDVTTLGIV